MRKAGLGILIVTFLIIAMGMIMVFNTTSAEVLDRALTISPRLAFYKQIIYGILGLIGAYAVWRLGYQNLIRLSPYLFFGGVILLALVFVPGIGQEINGAKRWLVIYKLSLQPSEIMKYLLPIFCIYHLQNKKISRWQDFYRYLIIFAVPLTLILLEPDNGTTAIILITFVVLFFLQQIPLMYWAMPLAVAAILGGIVAYHTPHVPDRIRIYLHPELDLKGKGHQPYQAKIAAGSGRIVGKGLGESLQKLNYLPEARSDYIAAIYAEEFGFLGILLLITMYALIGIFGFGIALKAHTKEGYCLAGVLTFLIIFQAFFNLGVVSGLLPSKGIALPFFSQGGSSLIINMMAIALLFNIAWQKPKLVRL